MNTVLCMRRDVAKEFAIGRCDISVAEAFEGEHAVTVVVNLHPFQKPDLRRLRATDHAFSSPWGYRWVQGCDDRGMAIDPKILGSLRSGETKREIWYGSSWLHKAQTMQGVRGKRDRLLLWMHREKYMYRPRIGGLLAYLPKLPQVKRCWSPGPMCIWIWGHTACFMNNPTKLYDTLRLLPQHYFGVFLVEIEICVIDL